MSDESNSKLEAEDIKTVDAHIDQLMEHFDSVQIMVTRHMPTELDGTVQISRGAGNWYARYGQVREFLIIEDERIRRQQAQPSD